MGFFDGNNGSPVRGLLGDDGARALDPNWMRDSLAENAMTPKPEKKGPNFGKILGVIGEGLLTGLATYNMSPYEAARFGQMREENKRANQKLKQQQGLLQQAHAAIDADPNMSPQEKALAKVNVEEYQKRWAEQYGTHNVNAGDSLVRGVGGGRFSTYTAPKVHEVGSDLIAVDPQGTFGRPKPGGLFGEQAPLGAGLDPSSGPRPENIAPPGGGDPRAIHGSSSGSMPTMPGDAPMLGDNGGSGMAFPIHQGRTEMERYADSFGARGTPEWKAAIQDWRLRGAGPTAYVYKDQLQDQSLAQSNTNNVRNNETSRGNNARSTATSSANNIRTNSQSNTNNQRSNDVRLKLKGKRVGGKPISEDEPIARSADGTPLVVRNGRWVPAR